MAPAPSPFSRSVAVASRFAGAGGARAEGALGVCGGVRLPSVLLLRPASPSGIGVAGGPGACGVAARRPAARAGTGAAARSPGCRRGVRVAVAERWGERVRLRARRPPALRAGSLGLRALGSSLAAPDTHLPREGPARGYREQPAERLRDLSMFYGYP
ncbi:unnamed protein product [Rangifer tarandus platyrhynchus]|uniref:Uncharacterized protein n=1 Tax=Rangifer tarandus platyrhynchus TaxID=3082113 RepID=A0AC59YFQ4_RANTA